ncbi:hypothetical protein COOONC_11951, partial [Cooperia oncophora]
LSLQSKLKTYAFTTLLSKGGQPIVCAIATLPRASPSLPFLLQLNAQIPIQMYDNGFRNVHSIDTESSVIEAQQLRNRERSELEFSKDDATSMSFGDDDFSVVIDKGTLDALLPPEPSEQQIDCVQRMFREVQRVLK